MKETGNTDIGHHKNYGKINCCTLYETLLVY